MIFSIHLPRVDRHGIFCFRGESGGRTLRGLVHLFEFFSALKESMKRQVTRRTASYLLLNPILTLLLSSPRSGVRTAS